MGHVPLLPPSLLTCLLMPGTTVVIPRLSVCCLNRPIPFTFSVPVTTVTFDDPVIAMAEIARVAVRCISSVTAMLLAVTPALLSVAGAPLREMGRSSRKLHP